MITISIDEKDPHVLRVSASYLLALASEPVMTAEIANNVTNVHNSIVDQIHGSPPGPAFNAAELAEAESYTLHNHPTDGAGVTLDQPDAAVIFGGKPADALSIAAVAPLPTAPVDTTAISSIPPPPIDFVPPVPNAPSEGLVVALPTVVHAVDVDVRGLPWDSRIHSREKTKLQNGNWKNKRGADSTLVTQVEAELAALMAIPVAVAPVIPAPPPLDLAGTVTPPPNTLDVPAPPATIAPIVNLSEQPFPALMQKVTAAIAAKTLNNDQVLAIVKAQGFPALPMLIPRPDLIPNVEAAIVAQINANIATGAPV